MQGFCQSLRRIHIDFMSCARNLLKLEFTPLFAPPMREG